MSPSHLAPVTVLALVSLAGCGTSMPPALRDELARSPRGTTTVVFFTDFQCPFCHRTHEALESVRATRPGQVRVVLEHVPLRAHPDARTAARAVICAQAQGVDIAPALLRAPSLSRASCEALALSGGVGQDPFRTCLASAATEARIEHDTALFDAAGGDGVPLLFVGRQRLEGEQSAADLSSAIDVALDENR